MFFQTHHTPIGAITLLASDSAITRLHFGNVAVADACRTETPLLRQALEQLTEYFEGTRKEFTLPLNPKGTAFQQEVWTALRGIPYGETRSYGEIAVEIGRPRAARAVGMANHSNPLAIFIPCHRVVGADHSLTGYAGGLQVKQQLLLLESNQ